MVKRTLLAMRLSHNSLAFLIVHKALPYSFPSSDFSVVYIGFLVQ